MKTRATRLALLSLVAAIAAAAAEVTIAGTLYHPVANTKASCTITITGPLRSGVPVGTTSGSKEMIPTVTRTVTVSAGVYSFTIEPNASLYPLTTQYRAYYSCAAGQPSYYENWYVLNTSGQTISSIRQIPESAASLQLTWEAAHVAWSEI